VDKLLQDGRVELDEDGQILGNPHAVRIADCRSRSARNSLGV
jgi:hypothetical protein